MSSISSNQSSVGNLILASNRAATSRNAAAVAPLFGKPSVPASGDLKGLYGQLAKSFLARRGPTSTETKQSALTAAASAATTTKSTSTTSSIRNADGDSVSLTKATSFKKYVSSGVEVAPAEDDLPTTEPAPTPRVTEIESGGFDLEGGIIKLGDVDREGDFTYTDGVSRINFTVTRNQDGTFKTSGRLFRDATSDVSEEFTSDLVNGSEIRLANYGQPAEEEPPVTEEPEPAAAQAAAATAVPPAFASASLNAARASATRFGGSVTGTATANAYNVSINGQSGTLKVDDNGAVSGSLGTGATAVDFTVDTAGELRIQRAAGNTTSTAADSEQAILVRTLLGKQESKGQVAGSGMFAAAGSKVITSGNTLVDTKMLKLESELTRSGGVLNRAAGSTSAYTFRTNDGATGTYSTASANSKRIDGTYVKSGHTTNFRINIADNGDSSVSTTGGGLLGAIASTLVRGLLGL